MEDWIGQRPVRILAIKHVRETLANRIKNLWNKDVVRKGALRTAKSAMSEIRLFAKHAQLSK